MSLLINKGSVFDLAATYIMLFKDNMITSQQKKEITNDFCMVLKVGWTFKEIVNEMHRCIRNKTKMQIDSIPYFFTQSVRRNSNNNNLMDPMKFYYHKELKIMNGPKKVSVDYDAGTMISNDQPFFLEMAASYTLQNLTDYFLSKEMIDNNEYSRNRIGGLLKYYVERYGLDETLYMIEAANNDRISTERQLTNIREFENYYTKAKEFIENIKTNCKYSGGDKITPRKRKLW